ncbi:MAG: recombination protein RecR, partial [Myxococcales bacterium]|nr:recombination protein RecR [Myxococcales bacterium]
MHRARMSFYPAPLARLIHALSKLPGIGEKTAARLAFHILRAPHEDALALSKAVREVQEQVRLCRTCFNWTDREVCGLCEDPYRDRTKICVVEEPSDQIALERTGFKGLYHVLHGAIRPLDGVGPEDLKVAELVDRLKSGEVTEVILATNSTVEGETTALYLSRLLKPLGVRTTRLARGLPMGGDLEYADPAT